ncbi:MAG: nicotinate (nicotinamide) nucleotide adenylyltransferase [Lachnospiraceae bacterium]|nr:nicotinate (nicotinamide) nucleotide adenylyltransferase [Lachnospiraceae bacterium]
MGGTFNPIHNSHIYIANKALSCLKLDKVLFIPNYIPPHKATNALEKDEDRLNMVSLAIEDNENFILSDIELRRKGLSYSSDTLTELKTIFSKSTLYFIMGSDSFLNLRNWHEPETILKLADIVVFVRSKEGDALDKCNANNSKASDNLQDNNETYNKILEEKKYLEDNLNAHVHVIKTDVPALSSTYIRENIHGEKKVERLVNPKVLNYIKEHKLYGGNSH